jgi:hypothetical protein
LPPPSRHMHGGTVVWVIPRCKLQRVLGQNKLLVSSESSGSEVCDAYQIEKAHRLPYPKYLSISTAPLDLVFLMFGTLPLSSLVEKNTM